VVVVERAASFVAHVAGRARPFRSPRALLALKFVEEGELSAGDVLHLFPEAADAIELADCGDVEILVPRLGFS
jgi:hypothetical protein